MNTKSPECWASDPKARGLRVEVSPGHTLLLPFDQFVFAELETEVGEQRLKLNFATHEIAIRGHSLKRIETAMQRMELALLTRWPGGQRSVVSDGNPVVLEIVVTEIAKLDSQLPGTST